MRYIMFFIMVVFFSGCGVINTVLEPSERLPLHLPEPPVLEMRDVEFIVIHKDNAEYIFNKLEEAGIQPVVFALTGNNYKDLAINISDIKSYLLIQRTINRLYKEYYEGK